MKAGKDLRISESTGRFIDILRKYSDLYTDICDAAELAFCVGESADNITEEFFPEYKALEAKLRELAMRSITANIGWEDCEEI